MPNLDFYAYGSDHDAVLRTVFELGCFRVFESDRAGGGDAREFSAAADVPEAEHGARLKLYVLGSGPEPGLEQRHGRSFVEGWGLVQLHFGSLFRGRELRHTHTNHNTAARAARWAPVTPELGDPGAWDWPTVTRASRRLNRAVSAQAVDEIRSRPVLPEAARLIERLGLVHQYGPGLHHEPPPSMIDPDSGLTRRSGVGIGRRGRSVRSR